MRKGLQELMYHKSNPDEQFMCYTKIQDFWIKHDVGNIQDFQRYERPVFATIKQKYLRVLTIVVFIGWDGLKRFEPVFVKESLDDDSLFFDEDQLEHMKTGKEEFLQNQFLFKPETVKEKDDSYVQFVDAERRLPFDETDTLVGTGGFGAVTQRTIVSGCLENISTNSKHTGVSQPGHTPL